MQRPRLLSLTLGFIAFAGWILFILACTGWPAWSPDGKQIAFPYHDQKAGATGVALYDREQKETTRVYLSETEDTIATAQWSQDGKQILLYQTFGEDGRYAIEVLSIPVKEKYPVRSFGVTSKTIADWPPLTEVQGILYMALNGITTLDLATWSTHREPLSDFGLILFPMGERVLYIAVPQKDESPPAPAPVPGAAQASAPQPQADKKEEPPTPLEFGELDQKDLSRHAWFTVTDKQIAEFAQCKGADLTKTPAVDLASERIAFTLICDDAPDVILVLDRKGMKQVIRPKVEGNLFLTHVQWAHDPNLLYAGLYVPGEKQKGPYGIAEVALDTGAVRLTPVTKLGFSSGDYHEKMRVSLSPDGSRIATSTALIKEESDVDHDDMALYVVDLRDPKRGVTKVHPPNWEPKPPEEPKPATEKKTE